MKLFLTLIVLIVLSGSCSEKNKVPDDILKPDKMRMVLTDILIADVYNNERALRDTSVKLPEGNAALFLKVFQLHQITRNEFTHSYNFYLKRPDLLKPITDSISAVINRKNQAIATGTDTVKNKQNGHNLKKITRQPGNKR